MVTAWIVSPMPLPRPSMIASISETGAIGNFTEPSERSDESCSMIRKPSSRPIRAHQHHSPRLQLHTPRRGPAILGHQRGADLLPNTISRTCERAISSSRPAATARDIPTSSTSVRLIGTRPNSLYCIDSIPSTRGRRLTVLPNISALRKSGFSHRL